MRLLRGLTPESPEWWAVLSLDLQEMPRPWTATQWLDLSEDQDRIAVHEEDREIQGFALYRLSPLEDLAHLLKIAIRPQFRGTGLAQRMMQEQVNWLRSEKIQRIYLEVSTENLAAVGFYRKLGFLPLRRVPRFYSDGQDAWTMEKTL